MRVLVTGSAGQVGSELPPFLAHHEVVALGRDRLDVADREAVEQVFGEVAPDAVVNCAANNAVDAAEDDEAGAFAVNALGVRHVAVASRRMGAHLVHVSSDYVFSGDKGSPYHEWDEPRPRSAYGRSKLAGEREAMAHAGSWTLARTAYVFGRRGRSLPEAILGRARAGEPLRMVDDQRFSPSCALDVASVLARLAVERRPGLYHVVNAGSCTPYELAVDVVELAGLDSSGVEKITTAELGRPAPRPAYSVLEGLAARASGLPVLRHYRDALAELMPAWS